MNYLRIGVDYFKITEKPLHSGDTITTLVKWSKSEISTDHGKAFLQDIPKYDGFVTIPSHVDYKEEIKGFYNEYHQLKHDLKNGEFDKTKMFLKHIFGQQYALGLDYLTILWHYPTQILPILCLVSNERSTGKTTFLNWLKLIFEKNMTINKNEDFRSQFNADWATKLIVAIDEVLLDRREDSERIKNLSTARTYKIEHKGKDKTETPFFGKFILCSNNEDNFILIDDKEIRYWVLKVPKINQGMEVSDLLEDLESEIPYFLNYINQRKPNVTKKTRMWFTKEQITTDALIKLVRGNKTNLENEIFELLKDDFIKFEKSALCYSASDLVDKLKTNNVRTTPTKISKILKDKFGLEQKNSSYTRYNLSRYPSVEDSKHYVESTICKGRYFKIEKEFVFKSVDS
ncbi:primase-helicase family protein [Mesoflavibacter zeaxanthinifaciens]|uniref:primase-helicase family protein n=1 Tax=Mesoflavibacter zeaxanthinifaciens TaxID=393060 RepID=UPI003A8F39AD